MTGVAKTASSPPPGTPRPRPPAGPDRPTARRVLAFGLLALGLVAAWRLPLRTFPEPRHPTLGVNLRLVAPLPPEEVARRWVVPLEGELRELGGVAQVLARVGSEGASLAAVLEPGIDVDGKAARLAGGLRALRRQLPEGASLQVDTAARADGHVTAIAWISGPAADGAAEAAAEWLNRQPGINAASTLGTWERWTRIRFPAGRPDAHRLARQARDALEDRLRAHPVGEAVRGGRRVPVRFAPPAGRPPGEVPVATGNGVVLLETLAEIDTHRLPPRVRVRFQGEPARALVVRRDPSASPLEADAAVRQALAGQITGGAVEDASPVRAFVSWSEAAPLRRLLVRGGLVVLLASILLAVVGRRRGWAGLAPWLGLAAAANLLWLAGLPADTATLPAVLFGLAAALTLVPFRLSAPGRAFLARGGLLAALLALVPLAVALGGGTLRWTLEEPALAFALSGIAAIAALLLLPGGGGDGAALHRRRGVAPSLLRRSLRDPATLILAGLALAYGLLVTAGPALTAQPRAVPRNPADLTVHLSLAPGTSPEGAVREVGAVERFLASRSEVVRQWSVIHPEDAFVFVELTPRGRRPEAWTRLEARLRAGVVTSVRLDVGAGLGAAGGGTALGSAQRLEPDLDPEHATFYRFVLRSADLETLRESYRRVTRRLGDLGPARALGSGAVSGWDRPEVGLWLEPRDGVAAAEWLPWVQRLQEIATESRPLVLSHVPRSYLAVDVGADRGPFEAPRLESLLRTAAAAGAGGNGRAAGEAPAAHPFHVRERLEHPRLVRQDGRFVVPVTVRSPLLSELRRREQMDEMERALLHLPLPPGASLELPDSQRPGSGWLAPAPAAGWRLPVVAALLLLVVATIRSGSPGASALALVPAVPAVLVPAPWVLWTLGRADEASLLALAAVTAVVTAHGLDLLIAPGGPPVGPVALYRSFLRRGGELPAGLAVAALCLLPLVATGQPLRTGWAVPAGVLVLGLLAGTVGLYCLLPAAVAGFHRLRREAREEAAARRHPAAWSHPEGPPRLEVRNLVKEYGDSRRGGHRALDGMSFDLETGIVGLLGPNGAGKTTLLRTLVGLLQPTRGRVLYRGVPVDLHNQASYRRHLGFLPQELNAWRGISGERFLELWALEKGIHSPRQRRREVERVLEMVELTDHGGRKVRSYSGGMRRRIGIAQALLGAPPLLVVDEPTAGLDLESRLQLRRVLRRVAQGRLVLLSTHLIGDVDALADRLLFLYRGRLRYDGPQSGFLETARGHVAERVVAAEEVDALADRFRVTRRVHTPEGVEIRLLVKDPAALPAPAVEPTLEEAYLVHLELARG